MTTSATPSVRNPARLDGSALLKSGELAGRILLSGIFLLSGLEKIMGYAATAAYMSASGVPSALLPLVIATEVLGSIAIIVGWKTRIAAVLLAAFTLLAAIMFHSNFADQTQTIMFLKDVSITGALLLVATNGAGPLSVDGRRAN